MKFQTIEKIRIYKGKYGFSTSVAKNVGDKDKPEFRREYLNVYFKKGEEPQCAEQQSVELMLDSAKLELYICKDGSQKLQLYVEAYKLAK